MSDILYPDPVPAQFDASRTPYETEHDGEIKALAESDDKTIDNVRQIDLLTLADQLQAKAELIRMYPISHDQSRLLSLADDLSEFSKRLIGFAGVTPPEPEASPLSSQYPETESSYPLTAEGVGGETVHPVSDVPPGSPTEAHPEGEPRSDSGFSAPPLSEGVTNPTPEDTPYTPPVTDPYTITGADPAPEAATVEPMEGNP